MNRIFLVFIILIGICACSGKESFVQVNSGVQTPVPPTTPAAPPAPPATPPDPATFNISISRILLSYYSPEHLYLQGQFGYQDSTSIKEWEKHSLEFAPSEISDRKGFSSLSVNGHQVCGVQNSSLYCWTDYPRKVDTAEHLVLAVDHAGDDICIINSDEELYCKTSGVWAPRLDASVGGNKPFIKKISVANGVVCAEAEVLSSITVLSCAEINSGASYIHYNSDTADLSNPFFGKTIKEIANYEGELCLLTTDEEVMCRDFDDLSSPPQTTSIGGAKGLVASESSLCVYTDDQIKCKGFNIHDNTYSSSFEDQLGALTLPENPFSIGETIVSLSTGHHSACAIGSNDKTFCWGRDGYGFSYNEPRLMMMPYQELIFTEIHPGRSLGCGVLNNGELYCFRNFNLFPVPLAPDKPKLTTPITKVASYDFFTYILSDQKLYRVERDYLVLEDVGPIKDIFFNHDVKCLVSESEEDDEVHCFSPGYNHRFTKSFGNDVEEVFLGKSSRHLCVKTDSHNKVWCTILSSSGAWSGELNNVTNYEVKKIQDDMVLFNDGRLGYIDGNNVVSGAGAFSFTGIFDDLWAMPKLFNDSFYGTFLLQEGVQYSSYKYNGADIKNDVTSNIKGDIKDIQTSNNTGCIHYVNEEIHCYGNNTYGQIGPDLGTGISLRELELPSLE